MKSLLLSNVKSKLFNDEVRITNRAKVKDLVAKYQVEVEKKLIRRHKRQMLKK